MLKIALLSDTHSNLDSDVLTALSGSDEIWHAGDFGNMEVVEKLRGTGLPLRGVWGNIDGHLIRQEFPEMLLFQAEGVPVFIKHIGGYPKQYAPGVKDIILRKHPKLFISGHSHILKIMYDDQLSCLHMNPGAAGRAGWHKVRTIIRFVIDGTAMRDCTVTELGPK